MDFALHHWALALGAVHAAAGAAAGFAPAATGQALARFPRSAAAGRVLSAAALFWCAAIVRGAELGRFDPVKPWLYPLAAVAWIAMAALMPELLAPRALGGLLLLAAQPLLLAARLHPASSSRFATAFAYAWVLAGLVAVAAPWHGRRAADGLARSPARLRAAGAAAAVLAAAFFALARAWVPA